MLLLFWFLRRSPTSTAALGASLPPSVLLLWALNAFGGRSSFMAESPLTFYTGGISSFSIWNDFFLNCCVYSSLTPQRVNIFLPVLWCKSWEIPSLKSPSQRIFKYNKKSTMKEFEWGCTGSRADPEVFWVSAAPWLTQKKCMIRKPNIVSLNR